MKIAYRHFKYLTDYKSQRELFSLSFPETKDTSVNSDAHYDWKFSNFPATPPSYQFVAESNGEICGYYAGIPYPYSIGDQSATCGMVCDVMTHPNYRGQGIFTKLGAFSTDSLQNQSLDFVSGYPIRQEVIPGHLKVGWFVAFKAPMYIHVIKLDALIKHIAVINIFTPLLNGLISIVNRLAVRTETSGYTFVEESRTDFFQKNDYDQFFKKWANSQKNYLIKNLDFLKWRTSAPQTTYTFNKLVFQDQLVGLAVTCATNLKGVPSLAILDIMFDQDHIKAAGILFSHLKVVAKKNNCEVVVVMINEPWSKKYGFKKNFFIKTPAVFSIIFKILNNNLKKEAFTDSSLWHLTWLDSDDL